MKANLIFSANAWLNGKELVFDFSGKKVRCNGKVLDKYSLCSYMGDVDHKKFGLYTHYAYDVCTYNQIRDEFLQYCEENCKPYQENPKEDAPKEDAPKEDAKRNLSEKVRNSAKGMQYEYIMDCVKNSSRATDEGKEFADDAEVLQFFADCFGDEFNHEYNKRLYPNISERIGNYLQGLPSVCSVDYWYDDIIRIGKDWGYCQTDKKAQSFCDNWFTQLGCRIVEMCNKLGVQI